MPTICGDAGLYHGTDCLGFSGAPVFMASKTLHLKIYTLYSGKLDCLSEFNFPLFY